MVTSLPFVGEPPGDGDETLLDLQSRTGLVGAYKSTIEQVCFLLGRDYSP